MGRGTHVKSPYQSSAEAHQSVEFKSLFSKPNKKYNTMPVEVPLDPAAISLDEISQSKKRILERAAELLSLSTPDMKEGVFERLLERERLGSTGMVDGVALPHARMPGITDSRGAFIRLMQPIDFDSQDGKPVDLIFALIVPEDAAQEHLQLLAELARLLHDPDTRQAIRTATLIQDVQQLFRVTLVNAA